MLTWLKRYRSDIFNVVSVAIGILGLLSGYAYYRATLVIPSLSLLDVGPHARVMNVGAVSDSPIRLIRKDGSPVSKNVYLARLYLWNSGNVRLVHDDIKHTLDIKAPGVEILDPKIITSPDSDITQLTVVKKGRDSLSADFQLLQARDGCSLNVLYAADNPTTFAMTGKVLGVDSFVASITSADLVAKTARGDLKFLGALASIFAIGAVLALVGIGVEKGLKKADSDVLFKTAKIAKWLFIVGIAATIAIAVSLAARQQVLRDPASFVPPSLIPDGHS
jgi:hypothetical protein